MVRMGPKKRGRRECMEGKMISAMIRRLKKRRIEGMHGREVGTEEEKDGGNAWEERAKEL